MKTYNITDDADRMKVGKSIKHDLKANRKNGFYDWQWVEDGDQTIFEFYWNFIDVDYIFYKMERETHSSRSVGGR